MGKDGTGGRVSGRAVNSWTAVAACAGLDGIGTIVVGFVVRVVAKGK